MAFKLLLLAISRMSKENIFKMVAVILLIPFALVVLFTSIFAFKSTHPKDVYLQAVREVIEECEPKPTNKLDGNLIKSIYFLYKDKHTEDIEEIKDFIKYNFLVISTDQGWIDPHEYFAPPNTGGNKIERSYFNVRISFKSYAEIQIMLLLSPFSFSAEEMILINLYLLTPPTDVDYDVDNGTGDSGDDTGGSFGGEDGSVPSFPEGGNDGTDTNYLPFRIKMPLKGNFNSYFGYRTHPVTGVREEFHSGVDISGVHHQPINSVADGSVYLINTNTSSYGNYVMVKHTIEGITFYSFYAHMSKITVSLGQKVSAGTMLGLEGGEPGVDPNPGTTTGHHLHLEIRLNPNRNSCIDPAPYLSY